LFARAFSEKGVAGLVETAAAGAVLTALFVLTVTGGACFAADCFESTGFVGFVLPNFGFGAVEAGGVGFVLAAGLDPNFGFGAVETGGLGLVLLPNFGLLPLELDDEDRLLDDGLEEDDEPFPAPIATDAHNRIVKIALKLNSFTLD
jgi:hypothetical protein